MTIVGSWTKSREELIIWRYWWLPFPQSGQNIVHYFSLSFILVGTASLHSWLSRGSYHQRRWSANSKKNDDHCRPMVSMMTRKLSSPKADFCCLFCRISLANPFNDELGTYEMGARKILKGPSMYSMKRFLHFQFSSSHFLYDKFKAEKCSM